ncbi:MAG: hypothetical protein U9N12_09225 [Euryarchaeota archaeon]|nr:hypothetical protein [Euryarchaeota archaeon]
MGDKKYYAARKGISKPELMDFQLLKKVFLRMYRGFEDDLYFQEATGYHCVDKGEVHGSWGCGDSDIEASIYLELGMCGIWPIERNIENYDEPTLFTVIEFLYDYVSEPTDKRYHFWNNCGWHSSKYDIEKGKVTYRTKVNEFLKDYDRGYQLSSGGEILEIAPTGLEHIFEEIVETDDHENIDMRLQNAISKYMRHHATISDKKDAVRELADVLEFLKKSGIRLQKKDESDLFKIIDTFDIRHHNTSQQGAYNKEIWYDWMFYTFLSSINVLLKLTSEKNGN